MENLNVIGYFKHGGVKWMLTKREDEMLYGFDITPLGKVHTLTIQESNIHTLVLIEK